MLRGEGIGSREMPLAWLEVIGKWREFRREGLYRRSICTVQGRDTRHGDHHACQLSLATKCAEFEEYFTANNDVYDCMTLETNERPIYCTA